MPDANRQNNFTVMLGQLLIIWAFCFTNVYRCTKDWREILVYDSEVVPNIIRIFEGTPVIAYCGSSSPVKWTYTRRGSSEKVYLTEDKFNRGISFTYKLQNTSIVLTNLTASNTGALVCRGSYNEASQAVRFSSKIKVCVEKFSRTEPYYGVTPNFIQVSEGDTLTLTCKGDKPVEFFSVSLAYQEKSVLNDSIILKNLKKEHSGLYYCRAIISGEDSDGHFSQIIHTVGRVVVDGYTRRSSRRQVATFALTSRFNYLI